MALSVSPLALGIFDHGHRTIGGESLALVIVAALVILAIMLPRKYLVVDSQGRVASRHWSFTSATLAAESLTQHGHDYRVTSR